MTHRRRPQLMTTVDAKTLVIINEITNKTELTMGKALDLIIQEWFLSKEIEPLKTTPKSPKSAILQNTLNSIDALLSRIADKTESIDAELFSLEFGRLCAIEDRLDLLLNKLNQAVDL